MKDKFNWFFEKFKECSERDQITMYNRYCEENGYTNSIIYYVSEMDTIFGGYTPSQFIELVNKSNFDILDKYFVCSKNKLVSFYSAYETVCADADGIFENEDIWKSYIDIDEYKDEVFDELSELKPHWMNDDDFYHIVSDAVDASNLASNIEEFVKNNIEREQEQLDTTMLKCRNNNY